VIDQGVKGRVTFDGRGELIGSGGHVPTHWTGPIQVEVQRREPDGSFSSVVGSMPAETHLDRLDRRAPLTEFLRGLSTPPLKSNSD
jgi:hypothetical protein